MTHPEGSAFHAFVRGRVQGVGFRYSAIREARRLDVRGTVRNSEDGSVEVFAEADPPKLRQFLHWLHEGPPGAYVRDVEVSWVPASGRFTGFDVEF